MKRFWVGVLAISLPVFASSAQPKIAPDWKTFKSTLCYSFRYPKDWRVSVNDDSPEPKYAKYVELDSPFFGPPWGSGIGKEHMNCEFVRDSFSSQGDLRKAALHHPGKLLREGPLSLGGQPAYESVFSINGQIDRSVLARDKKGSVHENIEIVCGEGGGEHDWDGKSWHYTSDRQWKFAHTVDQILSTFQFLDCPAKKMK